MILGFFQFFQIIKLSRYELLAYRDKRDIARKTGLTWSFTLNCVTSYIKSRSLFSRFYLDISITNVNGHDIMLNQ
jgi:hypothetical protein